MNQIPVFLLQPGISFTEPVYIDGVNLLVPAEVPIKKKDLDHLNSWGVDTVETDGVVVGSPEHQALIAEAEAERQKNLLSPEGSQENKGPYRVYKDSIERLDGIFGKIAAGESAETRLIDKIVARLIEEIRAQRERIVGYTLSGEVAGHEMRVMNDLAKSSVNVAILSALIAGELKLAYPRMIQVVTGALLHDVGMLKLPGDILAKRGGLSERETQRMQAHPLYSYKIVCKDLPYPDEVGVVVIQHHERWDGGGYPRRFAGKKIDIGARIVSVADAFEAMISEKPYRNSMIGYQAMKNLLADNSRRFDPDILKAFIKTMGIYPIGSIVLLNNGAMAKVVEVQGDAPLRPKIRVVIDESGKGFKQNSGALIDLLAEKNIFITRALDPKELVKKGG